MPSLLVTNDFPPKVGGIQSYLYELWRRLPPDETTVLTTRYEGAREWDACQPFRIERTRERVLVPTHALTRRVDALAREVSADVVFLDPMLPLGLIGARLRAAPFVVIAHGAEVTLPRSLPLLTGLGRRVVRAARGVVAAGRYPAREVARLAREPVPALVIAPGVDVQRFRPAAPAAAAATRQAFGLDADRPVVLGVSRLVPRKGFDVLIDAVGRLDRPVQLVIAGSGRDRSRLERRARVRRRDVAFLGRVPDARLPDLYACADVFSMLCRERWGGLEAEGFGIVFTEASACGVPSVAGRSGGAHEAVIDGETGYVVDPRDVESVTDALGRLLGDPELRSRLGAAARQRAERDSSYDSLAARLHPLAAGDFGVLAPFEA